VPLGSFPAPLLAKALQHPEVQPDLAAAPVLGVAQASPRFLGDPSFHPENHDVMQSQTSGVEPGLEVGLVKTDMVPAPNGKIRRIHRAITTSRDPGDLEAFSARIIAELAERRGNKRTAAWAAWS
jgi:hypothetical protein